MSKAGSRVCTNRGSCRGLAVKVGAGTRTKQEQEQVVCGEPGRKQTRRNFDLCCKPKASRHIIAAVFRKSSDITLLVEALLSFLSLHCSLNIMSCQVMYPSTSVIEPEMIIVKNGGERDLK